MRITPKILFSASAATIVVLGISGTWSWLQERHLAYQGLQARGERAVQRLGSTTARALYNLDEAVGRDALHGETQDPEVSCVLVYDGPPDTKVEAGTPRKFSSDWYRPVVLNRSRQLSSLSIHTC